MAANLSLLKSFVDGQGAGASTYTQYPTDLDSNFAAIEAVVNTINAEIAAVNGQNALIALDLTTSPLNPMRLTGFLGINAFAPVTFTAGDTVIQIPVGKALTGVGRIETQMQQDRTSSGGAGTRYVTLNQDGSITIETSTLQGAMDLYSVSWTGTAFTPGTLTRLPEIIPEGHDFANQQIQEDFGQGTDAAIPAFTYDRIADRVNDIVRILGGELTSADAAQAALNPIAFAGSVGSPGVILGNGTTYDALSGLFGNPGASTIGVSIDGVQAVEFSEITPNEPAVRVRPGTLLTAPPLAFVSDPNTGFSWVSADIFRAITGGSEVFRFGDGTNAVASFVGNPSAGSLPGLSIIGDLDTGWLSTVANQIETMVGGTIAQQINPSGQRTSATQGRAAANRSTQNVASGVALVNIDLTTSEDYDQGSYHDLVTNPDRMTVPSGFAGLHTATAYAVFDESTSSSPNTGDRALAITVNGTTVAQKRVAAATANDTELACTYEGELAASDIVRMAVSQDSTGTMDIVSSRLTVRLCD